MLLLWQLTSCAHVDGFNSSASFHSILISLTYMGLDRYKFWGIRLLSVLINQVRLVLSVSYALILGIVLQGLIVTFPFF